MKCTLCEAETTLQASVYRAVAEHNPTTGNRHYIYYPQTYPCCQACAEESYRKSTGLLFYGAMQLLWFTVARAGLHSFWGIVAALTASGCLIRFGYLCLLRYWQKLFKSSVPDAMMRGFHYDLEASDLIAPIIRLEDTHPDLRILSLREYRRVQSEK